MCPKDLAYQSSTTMARQRGAKLFCIALYYEVKTPSQRSDQWPKTTSQFLIQKYRYKPTPISNLPILAIIYYINTLDSQLCMLGTFFIKTNKL